MSLNNDCAKIQESLNSYIDNEDVDKASVENHLSECAHCKQVLQQLNDAKGLLVNLPPIIPERDFTAELEKKLAVSGENVVQLNFSKTAVAAIFVALTGIVGFYAVSNSNQANDTKTIAVTPDTKTETNQKIEKQTDKTVTQPTVKVAQKEIVKQEPILKKEAKKEITAPIQTAMQSVNNITTTDTPINIALNTSDLSSQDGLFDDMGFGRDEDGLYAIKL